MILDTSICANSGTLQAIYIIKSIIKIICVLGPIIVIITSIISLFKCVTNNDDVKAASKTFIIKLIICGLIFFVPTIITAFISFIDNGNASETYLSCYNNATKEKIEYYKEKEEKERAEKIAERKKKEAENQQKIAEQKEEKAKRAEENKQNNQKTTSTSGGVTSDNYRERLDSMETPSISTLQSVASSIGITNEYLTMIIGTTENEGYYEDPYLLYAWACCFLNRNLNLDILQGWDPYYSWNGKNYYCWEHIQYGYDNASDVTLKSVYLALTERNTKIIETMGMYDTTPSNYNLIYQSSIYDCNVYETK